MLILTWLFFFSPAQDLSLDSNIPLNMFEGAQLPHVFSQYMDLDPTSNSVDFNQNYTLTIP